MNEVPDPKFVPKIHPATREALPEDPLELMAEMVPGDPAIMLECILQEFAWMGWGPDQLLELFYHPGYPVLCQLRGHFGDVEIRRQIEVLSDRWGVWQFRETIAEPEPELVQLTLRNDDILQE